MHKGEMYSFTVVPFPGKACEVCGCPALIACPDFVNLPDENGVMQRYKLSPMHYYCLTHDRKPMDYVINPNSGPYDVYVDPNLGKAGGWITNDSLESPSAGNEKPCLWCKGAEFAYSLKGEGAVVVRCKGCGADSMISDNSPEAQRHFDEWAEGD